MNTIGPIQTNDMHDAISQGISLADGVLNYHEQIALGVIRGRRLRSQSFSKFIQNLGTKIYRTVSKYRLS